MTEYTVIYEIETQASSPLEAALIVEAYMSNGHFRPMLQVIDQETGESCLIDLEDTP